MEIYSAGSMPGQCRRHWSGIDPSLGMHLQPGFQTNCPAPAVSEDWRSLFGGSQLQIVVRNELQARVQPFATGYFTSSGFSLGLSSH